MEIQDHHSFLTCLSGNQAWSFCSNENCQQIALKCSDKDCECADKHRKCRPSIQFSKLKSDLKKKSKKGLEILQEVQKFYVHLEKTVSTQAAQIKTVISKYSCLQGEEQKLNSLIIENRYQQIISSMVAIVDKSLFQQPKFGGNKIQDAMKQIQQYINYELQSFDDMLKRVSIYLSFQSDPSLYPCPQPQPQPCPQLCHQPYDSLKFTSSLCNQNITIQNERKIRSNCQKHWATSLVQLPNQKSILCRFKLNNIQNQYFMVGICQLSADFNINGNHNYSKIPNGALIGSTYIQSGKNSENQIQENSEVKWATGDVLQLEFDSRSNIVIVRNIHQNTQTRVKIAVNSQYPLYLALELGNKDDEVQLLGAQIR